MRMIITCLIVLLSVIAIVGCSKKDASTKAFDTAFQSANNEVKDLWNKAMQGVKSNDYAEALISLMVLSQRTDLTPEQSNAVKQVYTTTNEKMYDAISKGDQNASEALKKVREFSTTIRR